MPIAGAILPAVRGDVSVRELPGRSANVARALRHHPLATVRDLLGPYRSLLVRWLGSDLTRGPVVAFAAHAGVGPSTLGGALYAFWQAAYHRFGQWDARGGAQGLTDALVRRATSLGVEIRCGAPVARIESRAGQGGGVVTEDGERVASSAVIKAIDPKYALLELLDPPLDGNADADLLATHTPDVMETMGRWPIPCTSTTKLGPLQPTRALVTIGRRWAACTSQGQAPIRRGDRRHARAGRRPGAAPGPLLAPESWRGADPQIGVLLPALRLPPSPISGLASWPST